MDVDEEIEMEKKQERAAKKWRLVLQGQEIELNEEYNRQMTVHEGEEAEQGAKPKRRKIAGHRKEVPDCIVCKCDDCSAAIFNFSVHLLWWVSVPADFLQFSKKKQVQVVCQERMKVLYPDKFKRQTKRSSFRSTISSRRKAIRKMRKGVKKFEAKAQKEEVNYYTLSHFVTYCTYYTVHAFIIIGRRSPKSCKAYAHLT